ncbi:MAG: P-II family nitrogen regulator [Smithellaceae bacterium]|nr:P-II family nitrogen regulator [Smithellaceae bacterium]
MMELKTIKKVVIIAELAIKTDILNLINELQAPGYTLYEVRGMGERGVRDYEATPLEYFKNIKFEILVDEDLAERIVAAVMENYFEDYAVIAYLEDVQIVRQGKFAARRD